MINPIQQDFDAIAKAENTERWNHNNHYHEMIFKHMPRERKAALDIGCGRGNFTAALANEFEMVTAVDFSHEMIVRARERQGDRSKITFLEADICSLDLQPASFDMIVSIATFHHLPFLDVIARLKEALKAGGVLFVLDIYQPRTFFDYLYAGAAFIPNRVLNAYYNRNLPQSAEEKAAWKRHAPNDAYLSLSEIRQLSGQTLPGSMVERLFFWRYALIWKKEE